MEKGEFKKMKRKILISAFFATIMLMFSFTTIADVPEGEIIEESQNAELIMQQNPDETYDDLYVIINYLMEHFGDHPDLMIICQNLLIALNNGFQDLICNYLWSLSEYLKLGQFPPEYEVIIMLIRGVIIGIMGILCQGWSPPPIGQTLVGQEINMEHMQVCPCNQ